MSDPHAEAVARSVKVFDSASDQFDHSPIWDRAGGTTVNRLALTSGMRVIDLCAGTGASALHSARAVGADGLVTAVDVSERMLSIAREKAAAEGLTQFETLVSDATATALPDASYDAAVCVFGVFFVPDMPAFVREMWRLIGPGGRLAITTWGDEVFQPVGPMFFNAVGEVAPALAPAPDQQPPWAKINTPETIAQLFLDAGAVAPEVRHQSLVERVTHPDDMWRAVLGSGFRGIVDALETSDRERLRERFVTAVSDAGVTEVYSDVLYAVATKPGSAASS